MFVLDVFTLKTSWLLEVNYCDWMSFCEKAALFLSQVRVFPPAPLPAVKADKPPTHICRFASTLSSTLNEEVMWCVCVSVCVMLGDKV